MKAADRQYIKKRRRLGLIFERLFVSLMNFRRHEVRTQDLTAERVLSILIIRHNQLGDAVAASPFIEAVRERWPNATVDVIASPANAEAFSWVHGVDRVLVWPTALGARLKLCGALRNQYDVVFQTLIDEHYLSRTLIARVIAGRGVAVGRKRGSPLEELFDRAVFVPRGGYVGKLMSLLTPFCEASVEQLIARHPQHRLTLPPAPVRAALARLAEQGVMPRQYIALNISARVGFREVGVQQAASLANIYLRKGIPVVLLHAPNDQARADEIKALARGVTLPRAASLAEAMAVAQNARLYLGADTGTAHFAAAGRTPCVVLFSFQARADIWSPYGAPFVSIQANPDQAVSDLDEALIVEYADRMLSGDKLIRVIKSTPQNFSVGDQAGVDVVAA